MALGTKLSNLYIYIHTLYIYIYVYSILSCDAIHFQNLKSQLKAPPHFPANLKDTPWARRPFLNRPGTTSRSSSAVERCPWAPIRSRDHRHRRARRTSALARGGPGGAGATYRRWVLKTNYCRLYIYIYQ